MVKNFETELEVYNKSLYFNKDSDILITLGVILTEPEILKTQEYLLHGGKNPNNIKKSAYIKYDQKQDKFIMYDAVIGHSRRMKTMIVSDENKELILRNTDRKIIPYQIVIQRKKVDYRDPESTIIRIFKIKVILRK